MLAQANEPPVFLSRGYGGQTIGPVVVDPARHDATEVGDEPLLLARAAPTVVARDRMLGAQAAIAAGARVIVMDDGFQNPSLVKDVAVLVVDARRGVGNARVLPAGPLRAPLEPQLARAHALVIVGDGDGARDVEAAARMHKLAVFRARLAPDRQVVAALRGRALAFAGIGDPGKFFKTLVEAGVTLAATRAFADHHRYTASEASALCEAADHADATLVTTEKDFVRLQGDFEMAELLSRARALPVTLEFADEAAFRAFLLERLSAAKKISAA
jgi:tetraacyldisaccharide 4'-kinase